jgi:multidrug efflux system outer membrane protein
LFASIAGNPAGADQFPTLFGGGNTTNQHSATSGPIPSFETTEGQVTAFEAWNLDFWGRYRRATEAARATLLANEWARKQVIATLVANVASSYFQLREAVLCRNALVPLGLQGND